MTLMHLNDEVTERLMKMFNFRVVSGVYHRKPYFWCMQNLGRDTVSTVTEQTDCLWTAFPRSPRDSEWAFFFKDELVAIEFKLRFG